MAGGRRAFVKAADPEGNSETVEIYRAEARIAAALPHTAPVPRLITTFEQDGWVVLLFEHVDGRLPAEPWRPDELARVLAMVNDLSATLTPCPIEAPAVADRYGDMFQGWRRLVAARDAEADPDAVTAVLAAMAGYFVRQARQPAPPGLPTLRAFQGAQGRTALPWLRSRLGERWS
ncbi:aminoglycoside phosphotransferase family protein [Planotetraspora sp. A-T 1434]|uniref:aminoglycoside phosphotransferase family protein n=1 Tax=Planotetraspora sp. A-T 1434 TaxID=2979219 RepID=UPI0021C1AAA7|nr:aminoglycoside phosphotransferase family protein [Planotetraspora sp. A-T 1434]MCT9932010.1 aminoglycoside phosphotransferase family protein [Planotetraspora sp. A-T 1434]